MYKNRMNGINNGTLKSNILSLATQELYDIANPLHDETHQQSHNSYFYDNSR